jgi:hypothetical protein
MFMSTFCNQFIDWEGEADNAAVKLEDLPRRNNLECWLINRVASRWAHNLRLCRPFEP